jgi:hyperosmotically inducible periplasmic protein
LNSQRDTLSVNATKEALKNAPHFKSSEWPDLSQPTYVGGVYSAYHIEPYFSTAATSNPDSTERNSGNLSGSAFIPLNQGGSVADRDRTAQIRKEILAGKGMSINARNVEIATVDGRVTLRGPVDTAEEKNFIRAIADRIARPENVDNQIEVKRPLSLN